MTVEDKTYQSSDYIKKRKKLSGVFFETSLPNEYLIQIGKKDVKPVLGGRKFKLLRKFIRVPASVQTLHFTTDNANVDYQGIGIEGFASWRINPDNPGVSIKTLDFFDEDNPTARTNHELRTICIEAVRHVISNMTIDEALKKKEDIADKLKIQLKEIEDKWGILFDQVGIEKVKIMSDRLFEDLQAQFRDKLRLDVAKTRIEADKEISAEESKMKEVTELKVIEADKKISLARINSETNVREIQIEEQNKISEKERGIREKDFMNELSFKMDQEEKNNQLLKLEKELEMSLQVLETKLLKSREEIEDINNEIEKKKIEMRKLSREVGQSYTSESLVSMFIEKLPEIYNNLHIDNYSILDSGSGGNITPVGRILNELIYSLKNSDLKWLLKEREQEGEKRPADPTSAEGTDLKSEGKDI